MPQAPSILIFGSYPPPFGGVPRHLEELAPLLVERGWDVHLVAVGHSGTLRGSPGLTVYREPRPRKLSRATRLVADSNARRAARELMIEESWADVIQFMSWVSLGREIIRLHGVKLIAVYNLLRVPAPLHLSECMGVPLVISNFGEAYSHRDLLLSRIHVVRRACAHAQRLLSMTEHCAAGYANIGLSPNVTIARYGVDIRRFHPDVATDRVADRLGLVSSDRVVLFVGRMIRDMGLHTVLSIIPSVLERDHRARFVIVGGRGELLPELERVAAKHPARVSIVPDVPFEDLPAFYGIADVVLAPTQGPRACGSLASLEAMASGKPVIAAHVGGVPEIVTHGETGLLIPPDDETELERVLLDLLADKARRLEMGRRGRARAVDEFDKDVLNAEIERIFTGAASSRLQPQFPLRHRPESKGSLNPG